MKRKAVILVVAAIIMASILFGSGMYVGAATKTGAGSQNDPVVSLSYLEYRLSQLENRIGSSGADGKGSVGQNRSAGDASVSQSGYEKKVIKNGERCMPGEGGVIVVYSGACTAVGKGLIDMTAGKVITESSPIPAYSQMLMPDGNSGVVASEETVIYVIIGNDN